MPGIDSRNSCRHFLMDRHWGGATLETYVTIRLATACIVTAVLVSGCQTSVVSVKSGTTTPVSNLAMYSFSDCTSWEPPEAKVTVPPTNGSASVHLIKSPIGVAGHPCFGKVLDRRVVAYSPRSGFKGQDRLVVQYDFITSDGGGRSSRSDEITINVQ
jgi:hypothetical protein